MAEDFEKELSDLSKRLIEDITTLPIDGTYKIIISKHVSPADKAETQIMLETLALALGRPDITIIIQDMEMN